MAKTKKSLRQRMEDKKKELANKGKGGYLMKQKEEGTMRVRILPVGSDNEFVHESNRTFRSWYSCYLS